MRKIQAYGTENIFPTDIQLKILHAVYTGWTILSQGMKP